MAEAFANHHGGDVVRADSAGLHPAPRLAAATAAVMREKGLEVAARRPRSFGRFPPERYDLIVNLSGSMLPNPGPAPVLNLEVPDPAGRDEEFFRQVRDRIEKQVTRLVSELRSACLRHAQRALAAPATLSPKAAVPR
jgi:arsenate reductase